MVIEEVNPPSKMRRVVLPSEEQERRSEQPTAQSSSLPLIPLNQEGSLVQRADTALERAEGRRLKKSLS